MHIAMVQGLAVIIYHFGNHPRILTVKLWLQLRYQQLLLGLVTCGKHTGCVTNKAAMLSL